MTMLGPELSNPRVARLGPHTSVVSGPDTLLLTLSLPPPWPEGLARPPSSEGSPCFAPPAYSGVPGGNVPTVLPPRGPQTLQYTELGGAYRAHGQLSSVARGKARNIPFLNPSSPRKLHSQQVWVGSSLPTTGKKLPENPPVRKGKADSEVKSGCRWHRAAWIPPGFCGPRRPQSHPAGSCAPARTPGTAASVMRGPGRLASPFSHTTAPSLLLSTPRRSCHPPAKMHRSDLWKPALSFNSALNCPRSENSMGGAGGGPGHQNLQAGSQPKL